jgi:hypothetical protein
MKKRKFGIDIVIELHTALPGTTHFYQYPIIEDFWNTLNESRIDGIPILVTNPTNMFLILALHAFREGQLKLKDIADINAIMGFNQNFDWCKIEEYLKELAWSSILSIPLYGYFSKQKIIKQKNLREPLLFNKIFKKYPYTESYPFSYQQICKKIKCLKKCKSCLFQIQKQIPGFPDEITTSYFIKYFPLRTKISIHFLLTFVLKEYGEKYVYKSTLLTIKTLIQTLIYTIKQTLIPSKDNL